MKKGLVIGMVIMLITVGAITGCIEEAVTDVIWTEKQVVGTFNRAYGTVEGVPDAIALEIDDETHIFIESRGWGYFLVKNMDDLLNSTVEVTFLENWFGDKKLVNIDIITKTVELGKDYPTHWYNFINSEFIKLTYYNYTSNDSINGPSIISGNRCVLLYDFTCEGLRKALNFSNDKRHITIDFPNGTMNVSGQHFKNSIFYVNGSHLNLYGKGHNIQEYIESNVAIPTWKFGPDENIPFGPISSEGVSDGDFTVIHKRSKEDTIFVVDNIKDNVSVFRFEGDNLTVSGIGIIFKQNTTTCAYNCRCVRSCFSDLYVKKS